MADPKRSLPGDGGTVGAALRGAEKLLAAAGIEGARIESTLLLGHVLGFSRAQLIASLSDPLTAAQEEAFRGLVARRAAREPLQYLRGRAPFLDFELEVGPGVFIPRPETEQVVEKALELWDLEAGRWAVDVGTGSGAIAIGLARGKPGGRVLTIDRNPVALATARRNAARLGVADRIAFVRGDLLTPVRPAHAGNQTAATQPRAANGDLAATSVVAASPVSIGIIVSNPPYAADTDRVDPEVRDHEPPEAYAAGPTGLEAYERLIPQAGARLAPGRPLVLELGYGQDGAVGEILTHRCGWSRPHVDPDYRDIPRVVAVRKTDDC